MLLLSIFLVIVGKVSHISGAVCSNVSWTGGECINWPCSATEQIYKTSKMFDSKNVLATRLAIHNDRAFVALPRYKPSVPFTLCKISLKTRHCEAILEPFPSWSMQEEGNCHCLQSVVDVYMDNQGILWALDTGIIDTLDYPVRKCPPKVVAFNPKSGKLVKNISLKEFTTNSSRLQYLAVENHYPKPNGRVFVYVTDASSRAILVLDATSNRGYRMLLPPKVSQGCSSRDVLYLGFIRPQRESSGCLVFSYLSGRNSFAVETKQLEDGFSSGGKLNNLGPKNHRLILLGTDEKSGRLYYRKEADSDVYSYVLKNCSRSEGGDQNDMKKVYEGKRYELPTHVVTDGNRRRMRVLESSFPDYFQGSVGCGVDHVINIL